MNTITAVRTATRNGHVVERVESSTPHEAIAEFGRVIASRGADKHAIDNVVSRCFSWVACPKAQYTDWLLSFKEEEGKPAITILDSLTLTCQPDPLFRDMATQTQRRIGDLETIIERVKDLATQWEDYATDRGVVHEHRVEQFMTGACAKDLRTAIGDHED